MAIDLRYPLVLLLLPVAFAFLWQTARYLGKMHKIRRRLLLFLRSAVFVLLILALAGTEVKWIVDTTTTIFVADVSDSMSPYRQDVENFISEAVNNKPAKDKYGVVSFGTDALVDSFISKDAAFTKLSSEPNGMYTDIEKAIAASIAQFPGNSRKRLVLLTDGEENSGSGERLAASIKDQDIDFKIYRIQRELKNEAAVESINVPQSLSVGEEFDITVNIDSRIKTGASLVLFNGNDKVAEEKVQLQTGSNRFVFKDKADKGGFRSYKVIMEPDTDTESRNNEASAFVDVLDKPKVLVLEDEKGEADEIVKMLAASGIDYKLSDARSAPGTLEGLSAYKSIISCNVSAENLGEGFLNSLETYVRDFGGGFIATGGENSFALGGYYKTPLEKVLPVYMDLKGKKDIPDMSIVLVIDKSGSMTEGRGGITKLDLAKEAAARVLDSLRPQDQIGVLTFDDTNYWVVKTQKAENPDKLRDDIGTIRSGGGTSILPALQEGYEAIKKTNTKIKHIILLTDGQAEKYGYSELVDKISKDGITVSTVAVGSDADTQLLESIAEGAGGRFYMTDEYSNIPRIFAKETFMAARVYLNNREFVPAINSMHQILSGVAEQGLPPLLGYVAATPKDTSRVLLSSDVGDPILSVWQFGLGKTAAWNSDINGKWSSGYIGWDKNIKLWQNLVNWTIEKYNREGISIDTVLQGGKGVITLEGNSLLQDAETKATIITPSLKTEEVVLYPTAPGQYSGSFAVNETGVYMINAVQSKQGETVNAISSGLAVQYSPEYKTGTGSEALDRIVREAGGEYINTPDEVYKGKMKAAFGTINLTPFLLILALLIFFIDIALRRLNLPYAVLEDRFARIKGAVVKEKHEPVMKTLRPKQKKETPETVMPEEQTGTKLVKDQETKKEKPTVKPEAEKLDTGMLLKKKKNREQ